MSAEQKITPQMLQKALEEELDLKFDAFTVVAEKDLPGWATMIMSRGNYRFGANFPLGDNVSLAKVMAGAESYWQALKVELTEAEKRAIM